MENIKRNVMIKYENRYCPKCKKTRIHEIQYYYLKNETVIFCDGCRYKQNEKANNN